MLTTASTLVRTVQGHRAYSNTIYAAMTSMITKCRNSENFEVNFTNLNDTNFVKKDNNPLRSICAPVKNSSAVKRRKSWVEYNHKKVKGNLLNKIRLKV